MTATATLTTFPAGTCEQGGCGRSHTWVRLSGAHTGLVCSAHIDLAREPGVELEFLPEPKAFPLRARKCVEHRMMTMPSGNRACGWCGALPQW